MAPLYKKLSTTRWHRPCGFASLFRQCHKPRSVSRGRGASPNLSRGKSMLCQPVEVMGSTCLLAACSRISRVCRTRYSRESRWEGYGRRWSFHGTLKSPALNVSTRNDACKRCLSSKVLRPLAVILARCRTGWRKYFVTSFGCVGGISYVFAKLASEDIIIAACSSLRISTVSALVFVR